MKTLVNAINEAFENKAADDTVIGQLCEEKELPVDEETPEEKTDDVKTVVEGELEDEKNLKV